MKKLLLGIMILSSISAFAMADIEFTLKCYPADGDKSPIITYISNYFDSEQIILNGGSNIGWGNKTFSVASSIQGSKYIITGSLSASFNLNAPDLSKHDIVFEFDLTKPSLRKWLDENSNFLKKRSNRALFTCMRYNS